MSRSCDERRYYLRRKLDSEETRHSSAEVQIRRQPQRADETPHSHAVAVLVRLTDHLGVGKLLAEVGWGYQSCAARVIMRRQRVFETQIAPRGR
jgi:hypothetical protein